LIVKLLFALIAVLSFARVGMAQGEKSVPVTVENFVRAESDLYFTNVAVKEGALGKFLHHREMEPIDKQLVIRSNRDTLYSVAIFDLDAGPVTVTLPDSGKRYMSLMTTDEDQYTRPTIYNAGSHTFAREEIGTRDVLLAIRVLADPKDPDDLKKAHALQDAVKVSQPGGPGKFEVPNWDLASQKKVRDALLVLASTVKDTSRAFGMKGEVDPVLRVIGAASAWGAQPPRDAIYLNVVPARNDGTTAYRITAKDVPVDAFWSISVYNAKGYFEPNVDNAYTLNNFTAKKNADGSITIQFGGDKGAAPNCCRSRLAGTTWCDSTARAVKS
jgi:hypothetical protein